MKNRLVLAMTLVVSIGILTACSQGTKETEKPTEAVKATEVAKETEEVTEATKATEKVTDVSKETEVNETEKPEEVWPSGDKVTDASKPIKKETEAITEGNETEADTEAVINASANESTLEEQKVNTVVVASLTKAFNCSQRDAKLIRFNIERHVEKIDDDSPISFGKDSQVESERTVNFNGVSGESYTAYVNSDNLNVDSIFRHQHKDDENDSGKWVYLAWDEDLEYVPGEYVTTDDDGNAITFYISTSGIFLDSEGNPAVDEVETEALETETEITTKSNSKKK